MTFQSYLIPIATWGHCKWPIYVKAGCKNMIRKRWLKFDDQAIAEIANLPVNSVAYILSLYFKKTCCFESSCLN